VNRSCLGAAAISWLIAGGLFFGVTGGLGAAPAGADSGTAGSSPGGPGANSNGSEPNHRDDLHRNSRGVGDPTGGDDSGGKSVTDRIRLDTLGAPGPNNQNPRNATADPGWCPPCSPGPGGMPGWSRQNLRGVQAPQSAFGGGGGGGNGGGIAVTIPSPAVPGQPGEPTPVQVGGGSHESAATGETPTVEMPPVIGLSPVIEAPLRPAGNGPAAETAAGGRPAPATEPNPVRERPPASVGNATEAPASFRVGYPEYLREAKTGEVAVLAVPGVVGLLALTALGGVVGYRQARAGHQVHAAGTARFLQ